MDKSKEGSKMENCCNTKQQAKDSSTQKNYSNEELMHLIKDWCVHVEEKIELKKS